MKIKFVLFVIWWIGFFVFYGWIYRPAKDTWTACLRCALFSLLWPLTPIFLCIFAYRKK